MEREGLEQRVKGGKGAILRPGGRWGGGEEKDDFGKRKAADVEGEGEQQTSDGSGGGGRRRQGFDRAVHARELEAIEVLRHNLSTRNLNSEAGKVKPWEGEGIHSVSLDDLELTLGTLGMVSK
ncbi:hypothetical protein BHE74_00022102 [Ensete ventricosum]|nr:hypothetical protein BHE74_00022102 [Ensete ventricosum]